MTSFEMMSDRVKLASATARQPFLFACGLGAIILVSALLELLTENAIWFGLVPLALVALAGGGWLVLRAAAGSRGAIIAYLAIIVFVTDGQFRDREVGDVGMDWQSLLKFALWAGAGVIGFTHMPPVARMLRRVGPGSCLVFIALAMMSSLYAPTPAYSLGCTFALLCFFAFAYSVVTYLTESEVLWTIVLTLAVFIVIGWVVFYVNPVFATSEFWLLDSIELRLSGIAGQANNLGVGCAIMLGAVFLLWWTGRARLLAMLPFAALGIVTFIACDARTGIIATVLGIAAVVFARSLWGMLGATLAVVTLAAAVIVISLPLDALSTHFSRSGDPSEIFTLTGRVAIWDFVWQKIAAHPLVGWGYNASKVMLPQELHLPWGLQVDTAHNMTLELLLSVGLIGALPIIALMGFLLWQLLARPYAFRDLFFIIIFITGLSDASALGTTPAVLTLFLFMIAIFPQAPSRFEAMSPAGRRRHGRGTALRRPSAPAPA